ncbi:MAG: peptidyl-prolyl cis-trans isomerase [Betaproteobacteria bacterium AqS2]|uniref:peptidylprolyl isomerase n=1 Tax=Candidatus Amphirhobacter heronislandensis TaxID=1732024 RepID=A0A930XY01_9GAMM|nr:peptidyl-prolyl cis-trans isomerase [Betaproteobacteria bacterium AqS2]
MSRILAPAALLLAGVALAQDNAAKAELGVDTYAVINGEEIPFAVVQELIGANPQVGGEQLNAILRRFVSSIVLSQEARRLEYDQDEEYLANLALMKERIAFHSFARELGPSIDVSEEEVKARYDRAIEERAGTLEYDSFHILVATEEEAQSLLDEAGGDPDEFMRLARTSSIDTGSGANGGYLGWSITASFVPEFAAAVAAIEPGGFSAEPVESQFGWHIIHVRDRREMTMPEFTPAEAEKIKGQLEAEYANNEARRLLEEHGQPEDLELIGQTAGGSAFATAVGKAALASGRYNELERFKILERIAEYQLLPRIYIAGVVENTPISEEEVQARYDLIAAERANEEEHRMYQLAFPSEEAATQALASLAGKPDDFKELAVLNDATPEDSDNVFWVHPATHPAPGVAALAAELADGEIGPEPILTEDGWVLLYRDSSRPYELPPLDDSNRELIIQTLQTDLIEETIGGLMEKAEITINNAEGGAG